MSTINQSILVGGVNSPVRSWKSVQYKPLLFQRGDGQYLYDENEQAYLDYNLGWGALVAGHAHSKIQSSVLATYQKGVGFGTTHPLENQLAQEIQSKIPTIEKIRFVTSGSEATMVATRLARAWTQRPLILRFKECYHGHGDLLSNLSEFSNYIMEISFNDTNVLEEIFKLKGDCIAGVILEPVCGNESVIPATQIFLDQLRQLTLQYGSVLIFDEVITGFRNTKISAQQFYNVQPDLTCLGKIIGGGLPCGAVGGKSRLMNQLTPEGKVFHAGTFAGNPVVMAGGLATLLALKNTKTLEKISLYVEKLVDYFNLLFQKWHFQAEAIGFGGMFGFRMSEKQFSFIFSQLLQEGVYLSPCVKEANFVSIVYSEDDFQKTIICFEKVLKKWRFNH